MAKEVIFSESISINYLKDDNLKKSLLNAFAIDKATSSSQQYSNRGGHHTVNLLNNKLESQLKPHLNIFIKDFTDKHFEVKLKDLWIIENKLNDYNISHLHELSKFSGIYYLQIPENSGNLVFERNDRSNTMQRYSDYYINTDSIDRMAFEPKEDMLIIFPSHLSHFVERNNNSKSRITASFNFELI